MAELDKKYKRPEHAARRLLFYISVTTAGLIILTVAKYFFTGFW